MQLWRLNFLYVEYSSKIEVTKARINIIGL